MQAGHVRGQGHVGQRHWGPDSLGSHALPLVVHLQQGQPGHLEGGEGVLGSSGQPWWRPSSWKREGVRGTRQGIHPHLIEMVVGGGGLQTGKAELRDVKVLQGLRPGSTEPRVYDAVPIAAPQPPETSANASKC